MKIKVSNYTFDKTTGQITFTDYSGPGIRLDGVLMVANTTRDILLYSFADPALGGTVSSNVLDLAYDTSAQNNADKLLIYYDDPAINAATAENQVTELAGIASIDSKITAVDTGAVTVAASALPSGAATDAGLVSIETKLDTLHTDNGIVETKLDTLHTDIGTGNTSVASIDTKTPALGQALAAASVPVVLPAATITTLTPQTNALTDTQLRATAVPVSAAALPLPSGASTESTLALIKAKTDNLDTALSGIKTGTDKIISAPATAANQATEITSLASIDGKITAVNTGAVVLAAGTAVIGKVSVDQTTPGTTDSVSVATAQGAGATIGVTSGAAVITDANGTLQQYLRGIVKLIIAKIGVTIADGDAATLGVTTGAAVVTDATGTVQQYLRGVVKMIADIWDSTNHWWKVRPARVVTYGAPVAMTITLNSLASSTAGVGRQTTMITGNTAEAVIVGVKIKVGTTPTINTPIYIYLLQGDGTIATDGAGGSDAGLTVVNAKILGQFNCNSVSTGVVYSDQFDTSAVTKYLGAQWGIAIVQSTGVALDASAGGTIEYQLVS